MLAADMRDTVAVLLAPADGCDVSAVGGDDRFKLKVLYRVCAVDTTLTRLMLLLTGSLVKCVLV